jgi:Fic family protein
MTHPFVPQKLPLEEIEWKSLFPAIRKANRSMSHYDRLLQTLPDPRALFSALGTQEAVFSLKIERTEATFSEILATFSEILKSAAGYPSQKQTRLNGILNILNYRRTEGGLSLWDRPLELNTLLELHGILLNSDRGPDKGRGSFRRVQNWVGAPGSTLEQALFVPPAPERLMEFLDNWEKYYHSDEHEPLVQLAILHAQFEMIHPFVDGNGRLGRILIPLFLFQKKLLKQPIFYLSAWIKKHRKLYIDHLRPLGIEKGGWNRWILFFLRALDEQAQKNAEIAVAFNDTSRVERDQHIKRAVMSSSSNSSNGLSRRAMLRALAVLPALPALAALASLLGPTDAQASDTEIPPEEPTPSPSPSAPAHPHRLRRRLEAKDI